MPISVRKRFLIPHGRTNQRPGPIRLQRSRDEPKLLRYTRTLIAIGDLDPLRPCARFSKSMVYQSMVRLSYLQAWWSIEEVVTKPALRGWARRATSKGNKAGASARPALESTQCLTFDHLLA